MNQRGGSRGFARSGAGILTDAASETSTPTSVRLTDTRAEWCGTLGGDVSESLVAMAALLVESCNGAESGTHMLRAVAVAVPSGGLSIWGGRADSVGVVGPVDVRLLCWSVSDVVRLR